MNVAKRISREKSTNDWFIMNQGLEETLTRLIRAGYPLCVSHSEDLPSVCLFLRRLLAQISAEQVMRDLDRLEKLRTTVTQIYRTGMIWNPRCFRIGRMSMSGSANSSFDGTCRGTISQPLLFAPVRHDLGASSDLLNNKSSQIWLARHSLFSTKRAK